MDIASFEKFLVDKIKVNNKTGAQRGGPRLLHFEGEGVPADASCVLPAASGTAALCDRHQLAHLLERQCQGPGVHCGPIAALPDRGPVPLQLVCGSPA